MPSRLSDAFKDHPVHVHDNHVDFHSAQELPESHTWPPLNDYPSGDDLVESLPVIDLEDPNAVNLVGHACATWGAFQVINHGIPMRLFDDIESEARDLFTLPAEEKLKAARSPDGVSGYGLARISPFFPKLMWSEGFTIVGSPLEHARKLWPQDYMRFCDVINEYEKELRKLANRLMWIMLGYLGVTHKDLTWAGPKGEAEGSCDALQLNSYPPCPDPNRAMGLATHTDSTLFTVLYQSNTSGLQVLKDGAMWVTVPPITGALVVNVGDLLHILTNGQYQSVIHRAVVHHTRHRLSVAYLYGPPMNSQISPLPKLADQNNPPLFESVTWRDYLIRKAEKFNKALSSLRLCRAQSEFNDMNDQNRMKMTS